MHVTYAFLLSIVSIHLLRLDFPNSSTRLNQMKVHAEWNEYTKNKLYAHTENRGPLLCRTLDKKTNEFCN